LDVDGIWGPKTEASVNAVEPETMLRLLCELSADRYRGIVERRPTSQKFLKGWLRRAEEVPRA
jgi:lysozyme family protein